MNPDSPLALLGGLTPAEFMRRYWQRKPLLIRQAIAGFKPPLSAAQVKQLARHDEVESRLVWRESGRWQMEHGPFARMPAAREPGWSVLVQSVDQHNDEAAELLQRFRFVPDARLDDLMISVASDQGGIGPHFDSYDVFLLQGQGKRRWRIGQQKDLSLVPGLPLKILARFDPEQDYLLEPGDMLYLPPHVAHDGIAVGGNCMTLSIGFRTPSHATLARGLLEAAADQITAREGDPCGPYGEPILPGPNLSAMYRDPGQPAAAAPAEIPATLIQAALAALARVRFDETLAARFLGCWLTEPNRNAVFDAPAQEPPDLAQNWPDSGRLRLDRRSRMLYRGKQLFINGEAASMPPNAALRKLADERSLCCDDPLCRSLNDAHRSRRCIALTLSVQDGNQGLRALAIKMNAILCDLHRISATEQAAEEIGLFALLAGIRIQIAHIEVARCTIPVVHGKTARIQRQADSPPSPVERLVDAQFNAAVHDNFFDARLRLRLLGLRHHHTGAIHIRTQVDQHTRQHRSVQAGVFLAMFPLNLALIRTHALFEHLLVADENFGAVLIDPLDAGAKTLARATVPDILKHDADRRAEPAFGNFGAVFGPIRFKQAGLRAVGAQRKALLGPEIDEIGKHHLGRSIDGQPAQVTVALDAHIVALRQDVCTLHHRLVSAGMLLVFGESRAAIRRAIARIGGSLSEVRWNGERRAAAGALVIDRIVSPHELIEIAASRQQQQYE